MPGSEILVKVRVSEHKPWYCNGVAWPPLLLSHLGRACACDLYHKAKDTWLKRHLCVGFNATRDPGTALVWAGHYRRGGVWIGVRTSHSMSGQIISLAT